MVQPTVLDVPSFLVWAAEAFELWRSDWGACYEAGSKPRTLLEDIAATWHLVSVTDNDFVKGELLPCW